MTNRPSRAVTGLVAILAAIATPALAKPILMSPSAAAGPAAANGGSVVRYGKYYEDRISSNCGAGYINCIVSFAKLPDTRHVHFTRIACAGTSSNVPISLSLGNNGTVTSPPRNIPLPVAPATYAQQIFSDKYIYYTNINQEIDVIMQKGSMPYVNFYSSGPNAYENLSITCTLTGEIV